MQRIYLDYNWLRVSDACKRNGSRSVALLYKHPQVGRYAMS
jgi:hypothetical protein